MLPTKKSVIKTKTADEALSSLMRLCARAERSSGDARRLMVRWGVPSAERESVLRRLINEKFIDDERYAEAFVREKISLSGWGERKINAALRSKGIGEGIIYQALQQLSPTQNRERLLERLQKKLRSMKFSSAYDLRQKLIRYGLSLGFTMDDTLHCVEQLTQNINTEDECDNFLY